MSGWNIDYFTSSKKEVSQGDANEFMKNNVNALKQTSTTSFDSVNGIYITTVMYLLPQGKTKLQKILFALTD